MTRSKSTIYKSKRRHRKLTLFSFILKFIMSKVYQYFLFLAFGIATGVSISGPLLTSKGESGGMCETRVAFSPKGGATELVLSAINSAQSEIRMATYSFTEPTIAKALLMAKKRNVDVAIVVDEEHNGRRKQGTPSVVDFLKENGVRVAVTSAYAIQHNKYIVVDGSTVQTGSLNYSRAAEKSNAENVLVLTQCQTLARHYLENWKVLWNSATN